MLNLCKYLLSFFIIFASFTSVEAKTLVAYFSATGNTQNIVNIIERTIDVDVFEIKPVNPYSKDDLNINNPNSRVCLEREDSKRQVLLVKSKLTDLKKYDKIFLAYPIWWGKASWVMDEFLKNNDFKGKEIFPISTSHVSEFANSDEDLKKLTKGALWQKGQGFNAQSSLDDVENWLLQFK